ncbi:MAG: DMT family transporter [Pseudorhodoplanes sp.]|nr:DMT family transporter [Pseudorhodoplanes sp.]
MLGGILLFALNDAMGKWLLATYTVGQVLLIRSLAALAVLTPFIWREGLASFRAAPRPGLQILRVVFSTLEVAGFYWAVSYLPLADVMTYYLAGPIYVTAISALFLREHVGWRRWTAVLIGFAGVIVAMRPSAATFSGPALIALAGSISFSLLMVATRQVRGTTDTVLVTGQTVAALIFGAALAPFHWVTPSWRDLLLLALLGVVAMLAHVCVNRSLKLAPASVVVPYQYSMIVWGIVFGFVVFGDVPDIAMLIGAAIIIGSGLYIFMREQAAGRRAVIVDPP